MKSIVLSKNGHLELVNRMLPPLESGECTIQVRAAGICSSDIQRGFGNGAYHYPLIMGHEFSGRIVDLGSEVRDFEVGEDVVIFPLKPCFQCSACANYAYAQCVNYDYYGSRCDGAFSEFVNIKQWNLMRIPKAIDHRDAALIEPMSVVVHALRRAGIFGCSKNTGARVTIIGAGFLGLLAIKILRHCHPNIHIEAIDRNEFKLNLATQDGVIARRISSENEWIDHLNQIQGLSDVVIEATGSPINFSRAIEISKQHGVIVWMGNITSDLNIPKGIVSSILRKEVKILGSWNSTFKSPAEDDWQSSLDLMEAGIRPSSLVSHWLSLADVPSVIERMSNHKKGISNFDHIKCAIENG